MLNKIFLHGPAGGRDPELRHTQSGDGRGFLPSGRGPGL